MTSIIKTSTCHQYALDVIYSRIPDPASHAWTKSELHAYLGLVHATADRSPGAILMATNILLAITPEQREQFLTETRLPVQVTELMATMAAPEWPDKAELLFFDGATDETIEAVKLAAVANGKSLISNLSNQIVDPTPRAVYVSSWLTQEAREFIRDAGDAADYPALEGFRSRNSLPDLSTAAQTVIGRGKAWATADSALQDLLVALSADVDAAEDIDAVHAASEVFSTSASAIVAALKG